MKKYYLLSLLTLCLLGWSTVNAQFPGQRPGASSADQPIESVTKTYALKNVNIVTQPGQMIEMGTVIVKNGLIHSVGKNVEIPVDAMVLDADSMYVYAGFIDGLSFTGIPAPQRTAGGRSSWPKEPGNPTYAEAGVAVHKSAMDDLKVDDKSISAMRKLGFTTVHIVPRGYMLPGQGIVANLHGKNAADMVLNGSSSIFTQLQGSPIYRAFPSTTIGAMSMFRDLYKQAEQAKAHEAQYAKTPSGMKRPDYDEVMKSFYPVIDGDLPIFFHTPGYKVVHQAYKLESELGFPLVLVNVKQGWHVVDKIKADNTPVFLSMELPAADKEKKAKPAMKEKATSKKKGKKSKKAEPKPEAKKEMMDPEMEAFEKRRKEALMNHEAQAATFAKAGISFGFTTASTKTSDIASNMRRMIKAGLTEDQALSALTTDAASLLGLSDVMGTVEKGKIANLIISKGKYFDEKSKVRFVIVDGHVYEYNSDSGKAGGRPSRR
ncbi:MAG: amidohydrolase family protein [Bacteroidota bacterium]